MAISISPVRIANMALSNIGARSSIEAFSEDTPEAQQVDLHYDFARRVSLEAFDWSFARKRQALAVHSLAAPEDMWGYRYQYPSDCLICRKLVNPAGEDGDDVPFVVEMASDGTKSILTDLSEATMIYTFDQIETSMFTTHFIRALSFALAQLIAYPLTGKLQLAQTMWDIFNILVMRAEAAQANEEKAKKPREAEWIRGRQ